MNHSQSINVKFYCSHPKAKVPSYQSTLAAGMDVTAAMDAPIEVKPMERIRVPTGLKMQLPEGFECQVRPRSGLAAKHGVTVVNAPGTIDADYRGEIMVLLINLGFEPFVIDPGFRIAQLVIAPVVQAKVQRVALENDLSQTERGEGGFGSTGV